MKHYPSRNGFSNRIPILIVRKIQEINKPASLEEGDYDRPYAAT